MRSALINLQILERQYGVGVYFELALDGHLQTQRFKCLRPTHWPRRPARFSVGKTERRLEALLAEHGLSDPGDPSAPATPYED